MPLEKEFVCFKSIKKIKEIFALTKSAFFWKNHISSKNLIFLYIYNTDGI